MKRDDHVRAEPAGLYGEAGGGEAVDKGAVEGFGEIGGRGGGEAGAGSFGDVGDQGELRDDEESAVDLLDGTVHPAFLILKDPVGEQPLRETNGLRGGVSLRDAEEDDQAGTDPADHLLIDSDLGFDDPLDENSHR